MCIHAPWQKPDENNRQQAGQKAAEKQIAKSDEKHHPDAVPFFVIPPCGFFSYFFYLDSSFPFGK
jgi:hypothetical protein